MMDNEMIYLQALQEANTHLLKICENFRKSQRITRFQKAHIKRAIANLENALDKWDEIKTWERVKW